MSIESEITQGLSEFRDIVKAGDTVRIKTDLVWVDGTAIHAGSTWRVRRRFYVKSEAGIEPRVSLENGELIITQVRLDQIERVEGQ